MRLVSLMTNGKCRNDHPFPYLVIRCWVRTKPPPAVWALSRLFKPTFWRISLSTLKGCHMDLWLARLVLTHHHLHRLHPSILDQQPESTVSNPFFFYPWYFLSGRLPFALFQSTKELLFSSPLLSKHVMRVALLFGPLVPRLAASTTVSLEWCLLSFVWCVKPYPGFIRSGQTVS